jgi:NAD(P)-dependent dehydrogenase (short-subunit alcohol dehydrogenase family)
VMAVDLRGVYVSCIAAGTRMIERGRGGIVITGSITASRTAPLHAYAPACKIARNTDPLRGDFASNSDPS